MHSWGSIFIQDVVMPLRKKPVDPETHVRWLRWSIIFVAVFAVLLGVFVPTIQKIWFFFLLTGVIWVAGSGALIIGGLYWRRATTAGAYCALTVGVLTGILSASVIYLGFLPQYKHYFNNTMYVNAVAMVIAATLYVVVSLITCKEPYELERLLHRGKYAVEADQVGTEEQKVSVISRLFGITKEFSKSDRILAVVLVLWNVAWLLFFAVFTVLNFTIPLSDAAWGKFWYYYIILQLIISVPIAIWFAVGGTMDIRLLLKSLRAAARDISDDGTVRTGSDAEQSVPAAEGATVGADRQE